MAKKKQKQNSAPEPETSTPNLPPGVKLLCTLRGHTDSIGRIAWSPDGRMLASPSGDKTIRLWDTKTGECFRTLGGGLYFSCVAFDPTGRTLASGGENLKVWEVASGRLVRTLKGHGSSLNSVAFDPAGRTLASGSYDKTVRLWDAESGRSLFTLEGHQDSVLSLAFDPTGFMLASGGAAQDCMVNLWRVESGQLIRTLKKHENAVFGIAFAPRGSTLATGGGDRTVQLWDADSGLYCARLRGIPIG
jgi:WD40 repeat protein